MKIQPFKKKAEKLTDKLRELFDKMPDKGNASWESQKICLINALNQLEMAINGTEQSDLEN